MVRDREQALIALSKVLAVVRSLAEEGQSALVARALDTAEYLPRLIADAEDRTEPFAAHLSDLERLSPRFAAARAHLAAVPADASLQILDDAIGWARSHASRLFAAGSPTARELVGRVVEDAVRLGNAPCRVTAHDDWWLVTSDADWMTHPTHSIADLFARVVAAPALGEHSLRSELLLGAFATDIITGSRGTTLVIQGASPPPAAIDVHAARFVAFRLAPPR